jgi:hypothetical protein
MVEDSLTTLVTIEGPVTGRSPRAPLTNLVLHILHQGDDPPDLVNYQTQISDGRLLRSPVLFIRDDHGSVPGCLCLNRDMTYRIVGRNLLEDCCQAHPLDDLVWKSRNFHPRRGGHSVGHNQRNSDPRTQACQTDGQSRQGRRGSCFRCLRHLPHQGSGRSSSLRRQRLTICDLQLPRPRA